MKRKTSHASFFVVEQMQSDNNKEVNRELFFAYHYFLFKIFRFAMILFISSNFNSRLCIAPTQQKMSLEEIRCLWKDLHLTS